jgi:hypothetical protein
LVGFEAGVPFSLLISLYGVGRVWVR